MQLGTTPGFQHLPNSLCRQNLSCLTQSWNLLWGPSILCCFGNSTHQCSCVILWSLALFLSLKHALAWPERHSVSSDTLHWSKQVKGQSRFQGRAVGLYHWWQEQHACTVREGIDGHHVWRLSTIVSLLIHLLLYCSLFILNGFMWHRNAGRQEFVPGLEHQIFYRKLQRL